jgi:ceramide glucosyltransferase
MEFLIGLGGLGIAYWGVSLTARLVMVVCVFVHPHLRRAHRLRQDQPPVSVVLPVKQLEPDATANLTSVFTQAYPAIEVLVSAGEQASPMIDVQRRVAGQFPQIETRFLTGNPVFTLNPKVSNVAPAIDYARYALVLIKDSNIWLAQDQLADLVQNLTPDVGLVCSIPIGVCPQGFAAEIECQAMNAYAPPPLLASAIVGWSNCMGKVMLFRRQDFYRAGGVSPLRNTFGDDNALGKGLARLGLRTQFTSRHVCQSIGPRRLRDVWYRQLRWMMIRRREAPFAFYLEPFGGCALTALAGSLSAPVLPAPWWSLAAVTLVAWRGLDAIVLIGKGWGWSWRSPIAGMCWDLILPILWLRVWLARSVQWGGADIKIPRSAPQ